MGIAYLVSILAIDYILFFTFHLYTLVLFLNSESTLFFFVFVGIAESKCT
jgi:hypothetical protein